MSLSAKIRELLSQEPGLPPKEIQARLAKDGFSASRNLCKVICHRVKKAEDTEDFGATDARSSRKDERRTPSGVRRLKQEDLEIWNVIYSYVQSLDDPGAAIYWGGQLIERHPEVQQWLTRVSTWRARRRRWRLIEQFIEDLKICYPKPKVSHSWELKLLEKREKKKVQPDFVELTPEERAKRIARSSSRSDSASQ